jgi:protein-tyrosine kinase
MPEPMNKVLPMPNARADTSDMPDALQIPEVETLTPFELDPAHLQAHRVVGFNRRDIQARPFSLLRSQVIKKMAANGWKIVGITSATPAVGKSFLSANLAAAMSRLPDRQIYLLDCDVRRGSLAELFGIRGEDGLAEFLEDPNISLDTIGRRLGSDSLSVYPAYPTVGLSAELFDTTRFRSLVAGLRALPDSAIILCDLPPAFANDDAMIISQQLDAYIMVVEQGQTTQAQLRDTMRLLSPAPCLGTVLNRYQGGFGDPYGYGYGYNDSYDKYY